MKPAPFAYHRPRTVEEATRLLATYADDARVLAGGQSLVPAMALRMARPAHLIDIGGIEALDNLEERDGALIVGAGVTHDRIIRAQLISSPLGLVLRRVGKHIAHHPIRVRGTMAGSLANADPAAEWCLVAAALGANVTAASARGTRAIAAEALFDGIMSTTLQPDELLVDIRFDLMPEDALWGFFEFSRRVGDYALAMCLATYELENGRIVRPKVGLGAVEARARRMGEVEAMLVGQAPDAELFEDAARCASQIIDPLEDPQADAAYRRHLTHTAVARALRHARDARTR